MTAINSSKQNTKANKKPFLGAAVNGQVTERRVKVEYMKYLASVIGC